MGECFYVAGFPEGPRTLHFASEIWMSPEEAGKVLAKDHMLNTTVGIWFYERDLWDKERLRRELLRLVEHVCSPEYEKEYEEWGARQQGLFQPTEGPQE